jgi:transposase
MCQPSPGQTKSRPILEDIKNYLQTEKPKVLPKSPIGDAIDYSLSNWEALLRYTEDGELEIDNNGAERSLRPIVVGRNKRLFLWERQRRTNRSRVE